MTDVDQALDDIQIVDVDTHVVEPYDLWTSRVSTAKYGDKVPHVVRDADGIDWWHAGDAKLGPAAGAAAAGWKDSPPNFAPRIEEVDPRIWQPEGRLELMDAYGIWAQVLYPNVAGFGAGKYTEFGDLDLALLLLQAYNDYLSDFAKVAPGRFVPIMAVPFWDIDVSIKEMQRCVENGHKGLIFSQAPETFGSPRLSDPAWDPLWATAQEMELSVNFHIGSGDLSGMDMLAPEAGAAANYASFPVTFFTGNCRTIATLIGGGICHRFPDLKFVSVESGVGWVPFALDALDWMWDECNVTREHPEYDLMPHEYFQRQIYACFWFERGPSLAHAIDRLGADNVLYETDFPHPTSMSPGPASKGGMAAKDFVGQHLSHLSPDVLRKVLHDNAAGLYHLD